MKLIFFLFSLVLIHAAVFASSEEESDDGTLLLNDMAKILNVNLDEDKIPLDQIPPNIQKKTTLPVTKEMMEIVQKLRDNYGSAWNDK